MVIESDIITGIFLITGGIAAGLFSGFFGIGGGTVLVPIQYNLLTGSFLITEDVALRTAFATSLAVTLPTAVSSAYGHYKKGTILWKIGITAGVSGFFGGVLGGFLATIISASFLAPFFALVLLVMAFLMISLKPCEDIQRCNLKSYPYILSGFFVGIISGMIGIGGGIILSPLLILFCRMPPRFASSITSVFVIAASSGGIISYIFFAYQVSDLPFFMLGYLNLTWWLIMVTITVPMAQVGVYLAHKFDTRYIRYLFVLLLLYISFDMLGFFS